MDLALFDFDGTLTTTETWTPFVRRVAGPRLGLGRRLAVTPAVLAYRGGLISASRGRQWVAWALFRGLDAAAVAAAGAAYAVDGLSPVLRPDAMARLAWHRDRGDHVVVVSASLDAYLHPWCARIGVYCVCTEVDVRDGRLTGRYRGGDCSGAEKVRRVATRFTRTDYDRVHAFGDSGEDRELLEWADVMTYRGRAIARWSEVTAFDHPSETSDTEPRVDTRHRED